MQFVVVKHVALISRGGIEGQKGHIAGSAGNCYRHRTTFGNRICRAAITASLPPVWAHDFTEHSQSLPENAACRGWLIPVGGPVQAACIAYDDPIERVQRGWSFKFKLGERHGKLPQGRRNRRDGARRKTWFPAGGPTGSGPNTEAVSWQFGTPAQPICCRTQ